MNNREGNRRSVIFRFNDRRGYAVKRIQEWLENPWNIWGDFLLIALAVVGIATVLSQMGPR